MKVNARTRRRIEVTQANLIAAREELNAAIEQTQEALSNAGGPLPSLSITSLRQASRSLSAAQTLVKIATADLTDQKANRE